MIDLIAIEKDLENEIGKLRVHLSRRQMAFGALFVAHREGGNLILMARGMSREIRLQMLADLKHSVDATIDYYKRGVI